MTPEQQDGLPSNVIQLSTFRVDYGKERHCECYRHSYPKKKPSFVLDYNNREISCKHCGNVVDPIYAFEVLATDQENWQRELETAFEQAKEIRNYKPWRKAIKAIEQQSNNGKTVPTCPHCHKGILIDEIAFGYWINKDHELQARKFSKKTGDEE